MWDDFKLAQTTADGFTIQKRTNPQSCWLDAIAGRRSSGLVFAGDVSGGLAVGVKNFWQSYPASLEVRHATAAAAELRVWLWSPEAPAMDLRHYDTRAHDLDSSYEDVQPGFSTPHGVARTSELTLFPTGAVPPKAETALHAKLAQQPPLLVAPPEHLHSTKVFGIWSLPDRSTAAKKALEDQLDAAFDFYHKEVEQRHWYGFWNYGDVMHQHDGARHEWRYDIGGFAWDNTELGTDMWLWYTFLRTGRADVFRMAEAMTRHTGEVDTYHLGRFAMLGSRHNVRHWGCGAKEARISQAAYRRFYYYLTTDERTGDLMREVVNSDYKATEIDPMRLASPLTKPLPYPGRVRGGPDWLAFAGNWMTEWERTGDTKWRDKIIAGMDSIAAMPFGFLTGPNQLYGYDPKTGKLYALEEQVGTYNLATIMGGGEVVFELNTLIDHAGWKKAWDQYCRLHTARRDVIERDKATGTEGADGQYARPGRLSGYLYSLTKNAAYAKKAWSGVRIPRMAGTQVKGPGRGDADRRRDGALHQQRRAGLPGSHRSAGDVRRPDGLTPGYRGRSFLPHGAPRRIQSVSVAISLAGSFGPGRHLRIAIVADGADQDASLGVAGHDGGAAGAALEQAVAIEERDAAVLELLVVASQAAALKDRSDPAIEEACVFGRCFLRARRRGEEAGGRKLHYFFCPTPNWLLALTTLPLVTIRSSSFSLCTSRPVSSFRAATTFFEATSTISPVEE